MQTLSYAPSENRPYNAPYVWSICLVAAMGGLLFGYDWVVINGAKLFYEKYFNLTTDLQVGWATSSALVGCLAGAVLSGSLSDRFGRKRLLILSAFLFVVSSIATGWAPTFTQFVLWRIAGGVSIGLASNLSPMYIAEVAPAHLRGLFVSVNQLTIVIGILAAQTANWLIARPVPPGATDVQILASWNGQAGWRWMFAATAVPALLFFLLMFFVPESPRWLVKNRQDLRARGVLGRLIGVAGADQALTEIRETLLNETERVDWRDLLQPRMLKIVSIGIVLAVFQQWCGINVILYYAQEVFSAAGYEVSDILLNIVIMGIVMLVSTLVALFTVDFAGRRILMLAGAAGLAAIYTLVGTSYFCKATGFYVLVLVISAVACYSFSLAPVTWVVLSEIFPNRVRGVAMSICVFALWAACFVLICTFPSLRTAVGPAVTFWIYAVICVGGFLFIKAFLPETKGKTLEQIERELVD